MSETIDQSTQPDKETFDEKYFHSGPYARVSFKKFSQYWWSNRYYAMLARRHFSISSVQGMYLSMNK